jgi:DNA polymerase III subunit beta
MAIDCNVKELRDGLSACLAATGRDGIKKNVHAIVERESIRLEATDNEICLAVTINATSDERHDLMLPVKRLLAILTESQGETVSIRVDDNDLLTVKVDRANYRLTSESARDFPPVAKFESDSFLRIPAALLRKAISKTIFSTDVESTRYALGGVLFEFAGNNLACVATDARRLAVMNVTGESIGGAEQQSKVIPVRLLRLLDKLPEGDVEIAVNGQSAFFRMNTFSCSGRLVEGRFPRYRDVIPRNNKTKITVQAGVIHSAVRQSLIVTNEENRGVDFKIANGSIHLLSASADVGSSEIQFPVEMTDGHEVTLTMDPKYVGDMLKVIPAEEVIQISVSDAETAALFTHGDSYQYVVMPLSRD